MKKRKPGQIAVPKDYPDLKGRIVNISEFLGEQVYVLDNGTRYTEKELQSKS